MNFNFNNQRTKFQFGPPIMRHFSTIGLVAMKPDQTDFGLKPDYGFKNIQNNILQNFGGNVTSNKSFSNPNFVNKQNPHILIPAINGSVTFDTKKFVEHVKPYLFSNQPKHSNDNIKYEENFTVYQPTPDELSSHTQNIVNKPEMPEAISNDLPIKTTKKGRNRKSRKNSKMCNIERIKQKICNMTKKNKANCSAPKKLKKEPEMKVKSRGKSKKCKPWHKISLDMEIMECAEPIISTPDTPQLDMPPKDTFCVQIKSSPIEILKANCQNLISEAATLSLSPCSDFLRNLSCSNSSSSDVCSMSPSSPAIRRLRNRMPSECDSEDSFIVFCDDNNSCLSLTEDETSSADELSDSDDSSVFDITEFQEKTDLNKESAKKKVTFRHDSELCEIHPMVQWSYAYQTARMGPWEQVARDRARFECRIKKTESEISNILEPHHRDKIYHERFGHLQ